MEESNVKEESVSIQLMSPASGDGTSFDFLGCFYFSLVSIQLMSPASGDN